MDVVFDIERFDKNINSTVTVGTFDGIHRGHQDIIRRICEISEHTGTSSILITFDPHPQAVLNSKHRKDVKILTTVSEKKDIVEKYGIDYFVVIPFSKEFADIGYEEFINGYLLKKCGAREIVLGYDHAFGKDREGSVETLRMLGNKHDFNVTVVEPVEYKGGNISSTRIRKVLQEGKVDRAAEMLGRYYEITGEVIKGKGFGRKIDFPTANLKIGDDRKLIPGNGIYIVKVQVGEKTYHGLIDIGTKPTFEPGGLFLEVYILDFSGNIYGQTIRLEFIKRLRDEIKFNSVDALVKQIKKDKEDCIAFFNTFSLTDNNIRRN